MSSASKIPDVFSAQRLAFRRQYDEECAGVLEEAFRRHTLDDSEQGRANRTRLSNRLDEAKQYLIAQTLRELDRDSADGKANDHPYSRLMWQGTEDDRTTISIAYAEKEANKIIIPKLTKINEAKSNTVLLALVRHLLKDPVRHIITKVASVAIPTNPPIVNPELKCSPSVSAVKWWCAHDIGNLSAHPEELFGANYEIAINSAGRTPTTLLVDFALGCSSEPNGYWRRMCPSIPSLIATDPDCKEDPGLINAIDSVAADRAEEGGLSAVIRMRPTINSTERADYMNGKKVEARSAMVREAIRLAHDVLLTAKALLLLAEKRYQTRLEQLTPAKMKEARGVLAAKLTNLITLIESYEGDKKSLLVRAQALQSELEEDDESLDVIEGRFQRLEKQVMASMRAAPEGR